MPGVGSSAGGASRGIGARRAEELEKPAEEAQASRMPQTAPAPPTGGTQAPPPAASFREVFLHTTKQIVERSFWSKLGTVCGCHNASCVKGDGTSTTNEIRTSKYTLVTFLPINLFEQFSRVANLYFLLTAGLQLIPGLSPTSWFTTVFPLVVVLTVNAVKEGYDDYHRHKNDAEINSRKVLVLTEGGKETPTEWRDVVVGDIVKVQQDQEVPADLMFMSSSDPGNLCYVETANLDGETNLKIKYCFGQTAGVHTADQLTDFEERMVVTCEQPNAKLYTFDGAVVDRKDGNVPQQPLTADNLLLRGCTLRKTTWVIGLVVFTGADTKIMMNRTPSPRKITQLERHMNILVIIMFSIQFFFAAMLAAGDQIFNRVNKGLWFLQYRDEWPDLGQGFPGWIIQVIRFIILLNGMIPISLYVTLEMVKVLQCVLLYNWDRKMYHADTDTPFSCRTTTLNEDLGQVQYVLSDKTGTLTQNVMGFVWASIGGQLYGKQQTQAAHLEANGASEAGAGANGDSSRKAPAHIPSKTPHSLVLDPELQSRLGSHFERLAAGRTAGPVRPADLKEPDPAAMRFLVNLAVCNTVVPQVLEDGRFVYQASSPDEEALVQGAAYLGYRLEARSTEHVEVQYHGQRYIYKVLATLEFNSDRKRMSIICRCPDGKIRLFCKGADTMIMARIQPGGLRNSVRTHLEEMAQAGYRTLCVAEKEIPEPAWNTWYAQYHAASVALEDREARIAEAAERIEADMELIGATAVEDKLQDGVPEAIEALVRAGIKVWVLTGDKVETAISIALSCRLFTEDMALVEVRERDFDNAISAAGGPAPRHVPSNLNMDRSQHGGNTEIEAQVLQQKLDEVESENIRMAFEAGQASGNQSPTGGVDTSGAGRFGSSRSGAAAGSTNVGLVIEGGALAICLKPEHRDALMALCNSCKSVVCCRVSPMQKAAVTKLVQVKAGAITLGIGDGANDVGMIQAAHIGVGISGREGRAAVLASDFAIAQFKYVARLVLLHGRAAYKRNTEVVLYSFYKNWVHNLTYVFFAFVNAFSAQPLYTSGLIATLNLFWASLPIIAFAILEQDVSQQTVLTQPVLYSETMLAKRRNFLLDQAKWLLIGTWHALVVYFLPMYVMTIPDRMGLADDWVAIGCTVYTATVITINLRLAIRMRYWTWISHLLVWASIALWFPFLWLYGLVWPVAQIDGTADMSMIVVRLYASPRYWLAGFLLPPAMSLLLDLVLETFQRTFKPKPYQILQEVEYKEELQARALQELGVGKLPSKRPPATELELSPSHAVAQV